MPQERLERYRQLLRDALLEADAQGRPARAAWLAQYLKRQEPGFSAQALGFPSFGDFLAEFSELRLFHDAYDLVAELRSGGPEDEPAAPTRLDRVDPALWEAVTRTDRRRMYLDAHALRERRVVVVDEIPASVPEVDRATRYLEIPVSTDREQGQWLITWAHENDLPDSLVTTLQEAVDAGSLPRALSALRQSPYDRQFLAARVQWTKSRLREWLAKHGIAWGSPIVRAGQSTRPSRPTAGSTLHDLVHDVVDRLSEEDLRQIRVPIGVVLDALEDS